MSALDRVKYSLERCQFTEHGEWWVDNIHPSDLRSVATELELTRAELAKAKARIADLEHHVQYFTRNEKMAL